MKKYVKNSLVQSGVIALIFMCISLFISGCAFEPTYRGQKIHPAYPEMVKQCEFVGEVTGCSNYSYTPFGRQFAKYRAMDEAARIGGTHIVWEAMTSGVHPTAYGRAYRCACVQQSLGCPPQVDKILRY